MVSINPAFDKLVTALRTAIENQGSLDKESTSYNDILDAFRLSLKMYEFKTAKPEESISRIVTRRYYYYSGKRQDET